MKKFLLSALIIFGTYLFSNAQCVVKNVIVKVNSSVPSGSGCMMNFDFVFTIQNNGGNKYIYIHSWLTNEYPNYFNCPNVSSSAKAPKLANLLLSRINLGVDNNIGVGHPEPTLLSTYIPDPNVTLTPTAGLVRQVYPTGDSARFTIKGVQLYVPFSCNSVIGMSADVWSSQAQNATQIHCIACDNKFVIDPKVNGLINCTDPRTFNLIIRSVSPTAISGSYEIYIDNPSNPNQTGSTGTFGPEDSLAANGSYATQISNGFNQFVRTNIPYEPFSYTKPSSDRNLWVLVQTNGYTNKAMGYLLNSCAPLQIIISDFQGNYQNGKVHLSWQLEGDELPTSVELQRRREGESFMTISGSSEFELQNYTSRQNLQTAYTYNDPVSNTKSTWYYRLKIVGTKNTYYSNIIAVNTDMQNQILIYPNPSAGNIQLQLPEDSMGIDITITDAMGRIIRNWSSSKARSIQVTGLLPGIYFLQFRAVRSGELRTERIIIR
jgi:hypothetical protein